MIQLKDIGAAVIIIGKDFGSMGRSKPLYYIEINNEVIQHGFDTQKEAKKYLSEYLTK